MDHDYTVFLLAALFLNSIPAKNSWEILKLPNVSHNSLEFVPR